MAEWSPDMISETIGAWNAGKKYDEIAKLLAEKFPERKFTRNMVAGLLKRKSDQGLFIIKRKTAKDEMEPATLSSIETYPKVKPKIKDYNSSTGISFFNVKDGQCRWIYDAKGPDGFYRCCGKPSAEGKSYCQYHLDISRQKFSPRNKTTPSVFIYVTERNY
jgi:hypothetical protein